MIGLARVMAMIDEAQRGPGIVTVGIGGPGASGKSTLAAAIAAERNDVQVVPTDAFWTGAMFDLDRLRRDVLDVVLAGGVAHYDAWEWATSSPAGERVVHPEGVIIIDGVCALHRMFRDDLDVRIWVETPVDVRLARGVARDGEHSRQRWVEVWMPNEQRYIDADDPIAAAHLIVDGTATL